jgi:hypothetical protein
MSVITISLILLSLVVPQTTPAQTEYPKLTGRWHVTFSLQGDPKKNLIFEPQATGAATFKRLDTGVGDKPIVNPVPAVWSQITNNRVSFEGEVELQLGDCCREVGTLIFKGKLKSANTITGKIIFVTNIDEEESPYQFRSHIGTFTATLVN